MRKTVCLAVTVAACLAGCSGWRRGGDPNAIRPTIAVMAFENRARFPLGWELGDGMRDVLVDRLVDTERYHVIERPELGSVLREIKFQQSGATRPQGRARVGRLKNVEYLIKGTITDFGHVATTDSFLLLDSLGIGQGGNQAIMGMTMYVVDVESGEIVASESLEESVRAGDTRVEAQYEDMAFGGHAFYRTPLGRATRRVIDEAVDRISETIAARPWRPRLAMTRPDGTCVLNGGQNRGVCVGQVFEVFEKGDPITDPETGDHLGHCPGRSLGKVRVRQVHDRYATAVSVAGRPDDLAAGQFCRPVPMAEVGP